MDDGRWTMDDRRPTTNDPQPATTGDNTACFDIRLAPRERRQLLVSVSIAEMENKADARPRVALHPDPKGAAKQFDESADRWISDQATISTNSLLINSVLDR